MHAPKHDTRKNKMNYILQESYEVCDHTRIIPLEIVLDKSNKVFQADNQLVYAINI